MGSAANPATMAIGAAANVAGALGGAFGGRQQPDRYVSPEAQAALRTGVAGAQQGLAGLPAVSSADVLSEYNASRNRLAGLTAPTPNISPEATTAQIASATELANRPTVAAQERSYRETAGAYGPTAALGQTRAGELAQTKNTMAAMIAQLQPQLQQMQFQQQVQQLQSALGLEGARQQATMEPFQAINQLRQGYTGQLLGTGQQAASYGYQQQMPAWGSAMSTLGQTASAIPQQLAMIDYLRSPNTNPAREGYAQTGTQKPKGTY